MPLNVPDESAFQKLDAAGKQQWFSETVGETFRDILGQDPANVNEELVDGLTALWRSAQPYPTVKPSEDTDWAWEFGRLGADVQRTLFRGWRRRLDEESVADPGTGGEPAPEFASMARTHITLPDGSVHSEAWDDADPDYEPSGAAADDPAPKITPKTLALGFGGIIGLVLAVGLYLTLTNDEAPDVAEPAAGVEQPPAATEPAIGTREWSTDDARSDFEPWDTFDPIDRTREGDGGNAGVLQDAADLVGLSVSSTSEGSRITVSHAGDAQATQAAAGSDFSESIVVVLADGTRWEVIFGDDGAVKVVSAPPGVSVTKEWITPEQVLFTLSGITVDDGSTVEVTLFLGLFGGIMLDTVELVATG